MSKVAWVFPGQGSQTVGMLAELAAKFVQVEQTFATVSNVLGYDLWDLVQNDTDGKLNQTQITQPALLTASVAIWNAVNSQTSKRPDFLAGHSLGEYSALVCAGVISLEDAAKLVEARGNFMQQAVPAGTGAMYAIIGVDDAAIIAACADAESKLNQVVSAVNFNSPGQVVIAGAKDAADLAAELCKEAGAKRALPLAVSVPSHCALMKPPAEQLAAMLENIQFSEPQIPVINNVDVKSPSSAKEIKDALVRQLYCPVRWTETVQLLASHGVDKMFEIGPGKVLTGLVKRIDKHVSGEAVNTSDGVASLSN